VWLGHRLAGEGAPDCVGEQFPGDGQPIAWGGVVERAAVGQLAVRVVQEEVRSAGGRELTPDLLPGVDQVGNFRLARVDCSASRSGASSG
jgi:hypothetical protein